MEVVLYGYGQRSTTLSEKEDIVGVDLRNFVVAVRDWKGVMEGTSEYHLLNAVWFGVETVKGKKRQYKNRGLKVLMAVLGTSRTLYGPGILEKDLIGSTERIDEV